MAKVLLSAILLILISMTSSSPLKHRKSARCPESWVVFENSCYRLMAGSFTLFEAQALCESASGYLVNIGSKQEEKILHQFGRTVWIGLNDVVQEGNFVWSNSQQKPTFTNWAPPQPNYGGYEHCVMADYYYYYYWNDENCMYGFAAICEKPFD